MLMTMDCPRCGFSQPTDRFCAQCGLDVEAALKLKPPVWRRIVASPRLYVGLIALLFVTLVFLFLGVKVPRLLGSGRGNYISSRDAAIPADVPPPPPRAKPVALAAAVVSAPAPPEEDESPASTTAEAASLAPEVKRFDVEFWEISHDQLMPALDGVKPVAEDNAGRAYLVSPADKITSVLKSGARHLGAPYHEDLRPNAQLNIASPPNEGLHFGLAMQLAKFANGGANFRLHAALAVSPIEPPGAVGGPPPRAVESLLEGRFTLTEGDVVVLVIEPPHRHPRPEFVSKVGPGPWQIFGSPNFQSGETDWIATVRLDR